MKRKIRTSREPPTIKDVLKELSYIQEKIDHLPLTDEIQQIQCNLLDFSKYLSSYLSEVLEWLKMDKQEYEDWFGDQIGYNNAVKELNTKIKKLKGGK